MIYIKRTRAPLAGPLGHLSYAAHLLPSAVTNIVTLKVEETALIFAKWLSAGKMAFYFQTSGGSKLGSCHGGELLLTECKWCSGVFKHGIFKGMFAMPTVDNEKLLWCIWQWNNNSKVKMSTGIVSFFLIHSFWLLRVKVLGQCSDLSKSQDMYVPSFIIQTNDCLHVQSFLL